MSFDLSRAKIVSVGLLMGLGLSGCFSSSERSDYMICKKVNQTGYSVPAYIAACKKIGMNTKYHASSRAGAYAILGQALIGEKRFAEAVLSLDKSFSLDAQANTNRQRWSIYSHALNEVGRYSEAIIAAKKALKDSLIYRVEAPKAYINLAHAYVGQGYLEKGIEHALKGQEVDPENIRGHLVELWALEKQKRFEKYFHKANSAISRFPNASILRAKKAQMLYVLGNYDEALKWANKSLAMKPGLKDGQAVVDAVKSANAGRPIALQFMKDAGIPVPKSQVAVTRQPVTKIVTPAAPHKPPAVLNKYSVAVIIGNKGYATGIPTVDFAVNDADAFRQFALEKLGVPVENVIDLRDATSGQLQTVFGNQTSHEGKLWRYIDPKGRSDVAVFYSGHGVPGLRERKGYLLPVDADVNAPEINGYALDVLFENLSKLKTRSVTVFLDACFSGGSAGGSLVQSASGLMITPKMPETASASQLTVLTAARGDQIASWDKKNKRGLFTHHLLAALKGKADQEEGGNGDGKVSLWEVRNYLTNTMTRAARRDYGRHQNAWVKGDDARILVTLN